MNVLCAENRTKRTERSAAAADKKTSILMRDEVDDFPDTKALYDDFVDRW